jgi:hypothetical protein
MDQKYCSMGEHPGITTCKSIQKNFSRESKNGKKTISKTTQVSRKEQFLAVKIKVDGDAVLDVDGLDVGLGAKGRGKLSWATLRSIIFFWKHSKGKGSDTN